MRRILVFGMTENPGGVESFLLNYYRNIDREQLQFDFLCNSHNPVAYEDELLRLGGRTFHIATRSKDRALYKKELEDLFQKHHSEWCAVWENVSSLANIDYLKIAKKYGIERRIIHSHNSQNMDSRLRMLLHLWNKQHISEYATDYWACSEDAAHWFYNDSLMKKVVLIHNAIDVSRMQFDAVKRNTIRKKYGLEDKFVIGNIGRLHFQKNQEFLIDVFKCYHDADPNSMLVLVGQGEDEEKLRAKVNALGFADAVLFAGVQRDIQGWLSAFDLFLFPSKFEGLSVAALEAQANGVPVLASEKVIPADLQINKNFVFYGLENSASDWADRARDVKDIGRAERSEITQGFRTSGYDIAQEAGKLQELLLR